MNDGGSRPRGVDSRPRVGNLLNRRSYLSPNAVVYACLFAVTAGIMVSVALQLFVESLSLNHNRNLSILFAFLGMTVLGLSGVLVSGD